MLRILLLAISHGAALFIGFAAGIFMLPILIAPDAPPEEMLSKVAADSVYTTTFTRERADSDFLHWGEGDVAISSDAVSFTGELAPGPDYKLYLSPEFIETEADFNNLKAQMVQVGPVSTFENFLVNLPHGVDPANYNTVIVWCETFGEFITSGQYRN